MLVEDELGGGQIGNGDGTTHKDGNPPRRPGEPRCKNQKCLKTIDELNRLIYEADTLAYYVSATEASISGVAYTGATVACLVSELTACAPAYAIAFEADVGSATTLSFLEDTLGYASAGMTLYNDYQLGNIGIDKEIGPYIGKDTVVAARNGALGAVPESILDFAVSASQLEYDKDRKSGEKTGGYVPIFSLDFVVELFFNDWW